MVVSDRIHDIREVSVPEGGTTIRLPVKAEWGAGAYLVATAYRPSIRRPSVSPAGRSALRGSPSIATGVPSLSSIDAPAKVRPGKT